MFSDFGKNQILHRIILIVAWYYLSLNIFWKRHCSTCDLRLMTHKTFHSASRSPDNATRERKRRLHKWEFLKKFLKFVFLVAKETKSKEISSFKILSFSPNHIVKLSMTKAFTRLDMEIFSLVSVIVFYEINWEMYFSRSFQRNWTRSLASG